MVAEIPIREQFLHHTEAPVEVFPTDSWEKHPFWRWCCQTYWISLVHSLFQVRQVLGPPTQMPFAWISSRSTKNGFCFTIRRPIYWLCSHMHTALHSSQNFYRTLLLLSWHWHSSHSPLGCQHIGCGLSSVLKPSCHTSGPPA